MHVPIKLGGTSVAVVLSLLVAAPVAAAPPSTFTCTGTLSLVPGPPTIGGAIPPGTYSHLVMPAGSACEVDGPGAVTVRDSVTLGDGAALAVTGGSLIVRGGIRVGHNALFAADIFGPSENAPVLIDGSVHVGRQGAFMLGQETPYGPVFATIDGQVTGENAAAVIIQNVRINGDVRIRGGGADNPVIVAFSGPGNSYNDFEDDQIHGSISQTGYQGVWTGIIRSKIWGSLTFARNVEAVTDQYDIGSNHIFGSAFCADNNPAPNTGAGSVGAPSIVLGRTRGDQASTCTGVPGGVTGPPV